MPAPAPTERHFELVARTQAEEDTYDYTQHRNTEKPTGLVGSVAHLVKGALGGGILGGHVAWKLGGLWVSVPCTLICGIYIGYCLHSLVVSGQILCRRTRIPSMTYPDIGEASCACHANPKIKNKSKLFRYMIDIMLCIELFGACAAYQLIIAKSIKQLVEKTTTTPIEGIKPGYPCLQVYLAAMIIPIILICLIRHLKYLAPLSILANLVILFCIIVAVYYAMVNNPRFEKLVPYTTLHDFFRCIGILMFSMSCVGVVIPVENNMRNPAKFGLALFIGMALIILCTFLISFFGYVGYLQHAEAPITVNFPLDALGKTLKACIAIMIYITHSLNFWVAFNTIYVYIKKRIKNHVIMWELIFRAIFALCIALTAIIFPTITALMGFLGALCLSNLAFIYPNIIYLLVIWERPGLGKMRWRLWLAILMIIIGILVCICGSVVTAIDLIRVAFHTKN